MSVIIEESDTNFGHIDIIWQGDVKFSKREDTKTPSDTKQLIDINKQDDILNTESLTCNNEHLKIYRYGYDKLNKPNEDDGPTLSQSLFIPNDLDFTDRSNLFDWIYKYLINQLMLAVVFTYYFPNGNYRIYFDYYMFEIFEKYSDVKVEKDSEEYSVFNITKYVKDNAMGLFSKYLFKYNDYEKEKSENVNKILKCYYNEIKKCEDKQFTNSLERVLYYFDIACRTCFTDGVYSLREKTGDFFVYKLSGPFYEETKIQPIVYTDIDIKLYKDHIKNGYIKIYKGHINNGYIGQLIRFISLKQTGYIYNQSTIKRPKVVIFRDAHATNIAFNDTQWINQFMNTGTNYYVLAGGGANTSRNTSSSDTSSNTYSRAFHNYTHCSNTNYNFKKSFFAGYCNFINKTNSKSIIDDNEWINTLGMGFILNLYNKPQLEDFSYGIDEYLLTNFLINKESKNKTIILPLVLDFIERSQIIYQYNYQFKILMKYFYENNYIKEDDDLGIYNLIREIEKLRNNEYIVKDEDYNDINLLLSLIPTKYSLFMTMFSNHDSFINRRYKYVSTDNKYTEKYRNKLDKYGITCKNNLLFSPFEWCMDSYNESKDKTNCPPANFYSGFYNEKPPSLNIGILRQPSDLIITVKALEENKFKNKLNISDYKPKVERDTFSNAVLNSIDKETNNIKSDLQKSILSYSGVDEIKTSINNLLINEYLQNALIWKALNFYGYDVNPEYLEVNLNTNDEYRLFNDAVIKLAKIDGWAKNTVNILVNHNDTLTVDQSIENPEYIMDKYNKKYLKYKHKYLKLKQLSNT
jgi:hypothetical protein